MKKYIISILMVTIVSALALAQDGGPPVLTMSDGVKNADASSINYVANAGQTYMPFDDNIYVRQLEIAPLEKPNPLLPELKLKPDFSEKGIVITDQSQHFLPGVTPEMVDWFWANMEKCYYLWAPGSHKRFNWVKSPSEVGFLNSSMIIAQLEYPGAPVITVPIQMLSLDYFPFTTCLEHVYIDGTFNDKNEYVGSRIHMWQAVPGGTVHITSGIENTRITELPSFLKNQPVVTPAEAAKNLETAEKYLPHDEYEAAMWPRFLPTLYKLWQDNSTDPSQNVQCDLRVKNVNGKLEYLAKSGPVTIN